MADERNEHGELKVRLARPDEVAWYNELMAEHHSLGVAASGRVLRYVAEVGGVPVVLGTFGSATWRVPVRDTRIGWSDEQRAARLERLCSNQRLCVLPAASGHLTAARGVAGAGRDARLSRFRRRSLRRLPRPGGWRGFLRVLAGRGCRITRELYLSRHRPDSIKDRYVMSCMRNARTGY